MSSALPDVALVEDLRRDIGADEVEAFVKRGRSRRLRVERSRESHSEADERGWAVRAGGRSGSLFACGTGPLGPGLEWPRPEGRAIRLPEPPGPRSGERFLVGDGGPEAAPPTPLASESELRRLAGELVSELERAAPSARLERLELEEGESESWIGSSRGVLAKTRTRLASVTLEVSAAPRIGGGPVRARAERLLPDLRSLPARGLATRLATLLAVEAQGEPIASGAREVVAAPEVATALLAGLVPLFVDPALEELADALAGGGDLGSPALTLVDDGGRPGGALAAPVDGEGTPTQQVVLVDEGAFRQQLLPWWRRRSGCRSGGCSRRDSWREPPRPGPSHFYLHPAPGATPGGLVGSLEAGCELLDACGPPRFDLAGDSFALPVRGFEVSGGERRRPVARALLSGTIRDLLGGLRAVAGDLTFVRHPAGLIGSPTVRLSGLTLGPARGT